MLPSLIPCARDPTGAPRQVMLKMFAFGILTPSGASPRSIEFPQGKPAFFSSSEEGYWNALDAAFILIMVGLDPHRDQELVLIIGFMGKL